MRKRNVQILFRLTEEEADELNELVRKSGRSKEAFLRAMVKGYRLCEKPAPEFYQMMRELSAMFLEYSELLNALDSGATTKITINNRRLNKADFEQTILIPMADDGLDKYRKWKTGF